MTDQSIPKARSAGVKGSEVTVETTGLTVPRLGGVMEPRLP